MKCTIILMLAACLQVSANGYSQTISVKLREVPFEKALKEIAKKSGHGLFYLQEQIKGSKPVSIEKDNTDVKQVLDELFKEQPLKYEITNKTIVVSPKEEKKANAAINPGINSGDNIAPAPPPNIDVTVRVTDEDGNPLAGASVLVRGTKAGGQSNAEGYVNLKNISENTVLEISYVGYENTVVNVSNRNAVAIRLKKKVSELEEVVVGKGYYEENQKLSVGNAVRISGKVIEKQPVTNPLLALQGRVPGLLITQNTGFSGGSFQVSIQGQNSITQGNDILLVVDGVPMLTDGPTFLAGDPLAGGRTALETSVNNPINFLNPADIEFIDVLKDADATAIYGSRAANGAIIITTKRGRAMKTRVNVELQQGWNRVGRKADLLHTRPYLDMRYEAIRNDGATITNSSLYYDLTLWDTTRYTDWQNELIGKAGGFTQANLSMAGGTNTTQYLIGGTYRSNTSVFPGDYTNKSKSIHFNINTSSANQKFRLSFTSSYSTSNNEIPGVDLTAAALTLVPVAPSLYNEDGSVNWSPNAAGSSTWDNPIAASTFKSNEHTSQMLNSNMEISYTILPGLQIKSSAGYNTFEVSSFYAAAMESVAPEGRATTPRSSRFTNYSGRSWIVEPQLSFRRQAGKLSFDALAGSTFQQRENEQLSVNASGFASDLLLKDLASATAITAGFSNNIYKYNALFGRLSLTWDKKYIINATARRDGSSRFGPENRFSNFWSIGAAWLFNEEKAVKQLLPILSYGKLRLNYGTTGNDGIGDYSFINKYFATSAGIPYQGLSGLFTSQIANLYLQWESTRKLQGGIDLGFFNDRILINATYVHNRSSNQLLAYPLPTFAGAASVAQNLPALVQNVNWEFSSSFAIVKNKKLTWNSSFNLTFQRNKLLSFPGIENTSYASGTSGVIVGQPLGVDNYYHYMGVDPATGQYVFDDGNGNPIANPPSTARKLLASFRPAYYGGFSNTVTYGSLTLDFLFQYVRQQGPRSLYYWSAVLTRPGYSSRGVGSQPVAVQDRWQKPGDVAEKSRYISTLAGTVLEQSDAFYSYDASFIRLKNVSLSWELPPSFLKKAHLQGGSLYFRGQNLATITNYSGLDPESQGNVLPPLQVWTIGFRLTL